MWDNDRRFLFTWQSDADGVWDAHAALYQPEQATVITYSYDPLYWLTGGNFVIANSSSAETSPALAWHSSANAYLVVWQRDGNVWARWDLAWESHILGRAVMTTKPKDDIFSIAEEPLAVRGAPTLAAAGEGTHLLAWEDRRGGNVDVYGRFLPP